MRVLRAIIGYLLRMTIPALVGGTFMLLLTPWRQKRLAGKGLCETTARVWGLVLFVAFSCGLFSLVVLPSGRPAGRLYYNLVPFRIFGDIASELQSGNFMGMVISFLGNIVMFVPLGFFPALLWRGFHWKRALLVGGLASLSIELCQLPLGRSCDIDDLWMNTLSAGLGYGLYHLVDSLHPKWTSCCKVNCQTEGGEAV